MSRFNIYPVPATDAGELALCPLPGRGGHYAQDLSLILDWGPNLVLSMTEHHEMREGGGASLAEDLRRAGISWRHLPIRDFGTPQGEALASWPDAANQARAVLQAGGRVLAHCLGGQGRSGMALLRILVEMGEPAEQALARLRAVRPGAVETQAQLSWALAAELGGGGKTG